MTDELFQINRYNAIDLSVLPYFLPHAFHANIFVGGRPRGLGLETRPWRGLPFTQKPTTFGCDGRQWRSAVRNGCRNTRSVLDYLPHSKFSCGFIVFALFGFLSPSNRGSLATVMMVCWSLFGRCFILLSPSFFLFDIIFPALEDTFPAVRMPPSEVQIVERTPSLLQQHCPRTFTSSRLKTPFNCSGL